MRMFSSASHRRCREDEKQFYSIFHSSLAVGWRLKAERHTQNIVLVHFYFPLCIAFSSSGLRRRPNKLFWYFAMMYRLLEHAERSRAHFLRLGVAAGAFRSAPDNGIAASHIVVCAVVVPSRWRWRCIQCANFVFVLNSANKWTERKKGKKSTNSQAHSTHTRTHRIVSEYLPFFLLLLFIAGCWCGYCRIYLLSQHHSLPFRIRGARNRERKRTL